MRVASHLTSHRRVVAVLFCEQGWESPECGSIGVAALVRRMGFIRGKSFLRNLAASVACLVLLSLPTAQGFSSGPLALNGGAFTASGRAQAMARSSVHAPPATPVAPQRTKMQVGDWVPVAARVQKRDPARLSPLKPLPPNIVIRTAFKKAEEPYEGIMERANPGDFGPDMKAVVKLAEEVGNKGPGDKFQMLFMDQGWRSYVVAEDTATGEVVGTAQLSRIQVGGYVYLTDDLQIKSLYVKPDYQRLGVGNHMVHELLQRLSSKERAWSFCESDTPPFFFFFSSGFVGINWSEAGKVFPGFLWLFLWPFHAQRLKFPNTVYFCAEGRGGDGAVNPAG